MILELDCGNSLIKWRVIRRDSLLVVAAGIVCAPDELMTALAAVSGLALVRCRMVSVRSDEEVLLLVDALRTTYAIDTVIAKPAEAAAGVRNGYIKWQRLGMDRWLAVLGAYGLSGSACLVLDLGTAITSDLVAADGQHLGGYICPGVPLMRNQLRTHTRRIRYDDDLVDVARQQLTPGRSTVEAVERGSLLMLQGFIATQMQVAREQLGDDFHVYLTGGDAVLVAELLPEARVLPDLVFIGLGLACP